MCGVCIKLQQCSDPHKFIADIISKYWVANPIKRVHFIRHLLDHLPDRYSQRRFYSDFSTVLSDGFYGATLEQIMRASKDNLLRNLAYLKADAENTPGDALRIKKYAAARFLYTITYNQEFRLLRFSPDGYGVVTVGYGNVRQAREIIIFVDGMNNQMYNYNKEHGTYYRTRNLRFALNQAARGQNGSICLISFGYRAPQPQQALRYGYCIDAAAGLVSLITSIRQENPSARIVLIGNSYGTTVVSRVIANLRACGVRPRDYLQRVLFIASPGILQKDWGDFDMPDKSVMAMSAPTDPVTRWGNHGLNPYLVPGVFGVSPGYFLDGKPVTGHKNYFHPCETYAPRSAISTIAEFAYSGKLPATRMTLPDPQFKGLLRVVAVAITVTGLDTSTFGLHMADRIRHGNKRHTPQRSTLIR